jgi:hypothetical protein
VFTSILPHNIKQFVIWRGQQLGWKNQKLAGEGRAEGGMKNGKEFLNILFNHLPLTETF